MTTEHPKALLERFGLTPKKSLGQNFLFDEQILAQIVAAAEVTADDEVLEIGPGLGALTRQLAATARRVVAVELDDRLLPLLHSQLDAFANVQIIHGDILTQTPAQFFAAPTYKVAANVPYYITGAILRHLLSGPVKPVLMALTIQKEVAQRLTAGPGELSLLAVSVQYYGRPRLVGTIKAGAFWPRPEVDSAIVTIDLRQRPTTWTDDEAFFRVARAGFSQKRKQLKNNLRGLGISAESLAQALIQADIDGRRRAETLSLTEWARLVAALSQAGLPGNNPIR